MRILSSQTAQFWALLNETHHILYPQLSQVRINPLRAGTTEGGLWQDPWC